MSCLDHSDLMGANLTTLAHFSVSLATNCPNWTGVIGIGTPPSSAKRAITLGSVSTALISLFSFSTMSAGVFLGTPMPCHELASYPGTKSPTGGRSGSAGERAAVVTANPRSLPALFDDRRHHIETHLKSAGQQVRNDLPPTTTIRHMNDVDAGHHLEQLACEKKRTCGWRTEVELSRIGFRVCDELRDRLDWELRSY